MANEEHLAILRQGVAVWNAWRERHPGVEPDLYGADIGEANLVEVDFNGVCLDGANLAGSHLIGAILIRADLIEANLDGANLTGATLSFADLTAAVLNKADLTGADLIGTILREANLTRGTLSGSNLSGADLSGANLTEASLIETKFTGAVFRGATVTRAFIGQAVFAHNDLRNVIGITEARHFRPSSIDIDTLVRSKGKIPESFLRGCGMPDSFIEYLPSLIGAMEPIQFYSCFISYSTKDKDFAKRLHGRMHQEGLRVWFAPEDMKGGKKLHEQIERAIQYHDRLLLILSDHSLQSEWVMTELYNARKVELKENRRKLFPIRLTDMDTIKAWKCFDADTGKDLAREVREYYIPDFILWKDHDAFEREFAKLLDALKATEAPPVPRAEPPKPKSKDIPQNPQLIIARKKRRLEKLEERQAIMGISTPPEVLTEIEDLRREIEQMGG